MSALTLRDATAADLPAIVAMLADDVNGATREDAALPLDPAYAAAFEAIAREPNHRLIVAEREGAVVGTMQLSFHPGLSYRGDWRAQIEAVRVLRALRGQGFGAEMIGWAVEQARARGCHLVQLTSHAGRGDAHRFYERLGFTASHVGMKLHLGS
jgi:GNAT superfamily N-acetyltransferase